MEQYNDTKVIALLSEIKAEVKGQSELLSETRTDTKDILDRVARLEENNSRSAPLVNDLDHTVQGHEHRIGALETFKGAHCKDHTDSRTTSGNRAWDLFKAFISPIAVAIVTWIIATKGGGK